MRWLVAAALALLCTLGFAAPDPQDKAGSSDPPPFTRMKGFHIYNFDDKPFDRFEFPVAPDKVQVVEGRRLYVDYYANEGVKHPSALQIVRNYSNAAKAIGGSIVYEYDDGGTLISVLRLAKGGAETWVHVAGAGNGMYKIHVVEKQAMAQEVVADAALMAGSLREAGRVAIYGIHFDTDKADIKPASEPTLAEIGKLLRADAKLRLYVVGHTDNAGAFDHNVRLSQARAAAVVAALVKANPAVAARLQPFGAGPTSPVASNVNDAGKAKNRRVELVAQ